MATELLFSRETNIPWGFRLTGGSDCEVPLTVIKVTEGSIAETIGMKVGDALIQINDIETASLTHVQAHDVILQAGDNFVATVIRGEISEQLTETSISDSEIINVTLPLPKKAKAMEDLAETVPNPTSEVVHNVDVLPVIQEDPHLENKESIVMDNNNMVQSQELAADDEVAAIIPQELEVLTDAELMGVDFQKFMPMIDILKESEVFTTFSKGLKEKRDQRKEDEKKWTTFLQKPKRPAPKSKKVEEEKPKGQPYKVEIKIVKKPKEEVQAEKQEGYKVQIKTKKQREQEELLLQQQLLEQQQQQQQELLEQQNEMEAEEDQEQDAVEEEDQEEVEEEAGEETEQEPAEVELSVEERLANVQKQLLTLSQLPIAIQQTLDAVTQQLAKIVGPQIDPNAVEENPEMTDDNSEEITEDDELTEMIEEHEEDEEDGTEPTEEEQEDVESEKEPEPEPEPELSPEEMEERRVEQQKIDKKEKELEQLKEQQQRRLKQRPSVPLAPLRRPIRLPGGEQWSNPDDAFPKFRHKDMSDDLIAETISSQSEVLCGTTLGINFMKYQPVVKPLEHLKNSEVFKLIHDMDEPARGIMNREGMVMAETDYYKSIQGKTENFSVSKEMECQ